MFLFLNIVFIILPIYFEGIKGSGLQSLVDPMLCFTKNDQPDRLGFDYSCQSDPEDISAEFLDTYKYPLGTYDDFNDKFMANELGYREEEAKLMTVILQFVTDSTIPVTSCCYKGTRLEPEWKNCTLIYKEDKSCRETDRVSDMSVSPCYSSSKSECDGIVYFPMPNTPLGCCPKNACLERNICSE